MFTPELQGLKREAIAFRRLIDSCDKGVTCLLSTFPVGSCKVASMLLAYHLISKWPNAVVYGVLGYAKDRNGEDNISHYWLEVGDTVIDITADQYNYINNDHLNDAIVQSRPFPAVYATDEFETVQYRLFDVVGSDCYRKGFSEVAEDFLFDMRRSYSQIMACERAGQIDS